MSWSLNWRKLKLVDSAKLTDCHVRVMIRIAVIALCEAMVSILMAVLGKAMAFLLE